MSRQRQRQQQRQPIEEGVRLALSDLLARMGDVDVERHCYDWRADDLLVWVHLNAPMTDAALMLLQNQIAQKMRDLLPPDQPLGDWLVVVQHKGETLCRIAWDK